MAGRAGLIGLAEIHAIGELQAGNLPRMVLNFQVGFQQFNVDLFPLHRAVALGAGVVEGKIAIVGFHEFPDHVVHGVADSQSQARRHKSCKYLRRVEFTA